MLPSVAGVQSVLVAESAFSSNERATSLLCLHLSPLCTITANPHWNTLHKVPPSWQKDPPEHRPVVSEAALASAGAVVAGSGLHCDFRSTTLQISEATGPSNHLGAACLRLFFFLTSLLMKRFPATHCY